MSGDDTLLREGPDPTVETREFWQHCAAGTLMIKICLDCREKHYFPRQICPFCFSSRTQWLATSGMATIYSYSVMRRAKPPYAISYVTLDEGVAMMTNIVDCDLDAIRIGQKVKLVWKPSTTGLSIPMFTPA